MRSVIKYQYRKGADNEDDTIFSSKLTAVLDWDGAEIQITGQYLKNLRFADDIVLMSESTGELQQLILQTKPESGF